MSKDATTGGMDTPEDPGNHFPEFHHGAPPFDRPPSPPPWAKLEERVAVLETAIAKQRTINEMLLLFMRWLGTIRADNIADTILNALPPHQDHKPPSP